MFTLMNIGLKLVFSGAVLQFFPCSLWYKLFLSEWQPDTLAISWNYNKNYYLFFIMNLILLKHLVDKNILTLRAEKSILISLCFERSVHSNTIY